MAADTARSVIFTSKQFEEDFNPVLFTKKIKNLNFNQSKQSQDVIESRLH